MQSIIVGCASKEARETKYLIALLIKTDYLDLNENYVQSLIKDIEKIIKLLTSIVKSSMEKK
ncbi:MAG: four helix bundle protein [Campylobacterota bacterium]|nr:four helix bundle protein [Campylobacterota bacterium]